MTRRNGPPVDPEWDRARSVRHPAAKGWQMIRNGLGRAQAGVGTLRIAVMGDSVSAGYKNNPGVDDPWTRVKQHAKGCGYAIGELVWLYNVTTPPNGPVNPKLTFSGTWAPVTASIYGGAGDMQYISTDAGTVFELVYTSPGTFTVTIDGTDHTVPASNNLMSKYRLTGLANTTHTCIVRGAGGGVCYVAAIGIQPAAGIVMINAARSGSQTSDWLPDANYYSNYLTFVATAPDVAIIEQGGNDQGLGATPQQYYDRLLSLSSNLQGSGVVGRLYVASHVMAGAHLANLYRAADFDNAGLLDLVDRMGDMTGMLADDNLHLNNTGECVMAKSLTDAFGFTPIA